MTPEPLGSSLFSTEEAFKLTLGTPIQAYTSHRIPELLQTRGHYCLSDNRLSRYQALPSENPDVTTSVCGILNPTSLIPNSAEDSPFYSCSEVLFISSNPRPNLSDQSLDIPDIIWFTDVSSFVLEGKRMAGYAVVSFYQTIGV